MLRSVQIRLICRFAEAGGESWLIDPAGIAASRPGGHLPVLRGPRWRTELSAAGPPGWGSREQAA